MAHAGDELCNTQTEKQRIVLRKTAKETDGALLEMEAYYKPGGHYPPEHYHPLQDEHFEVTKGQLHVRLNGVQVTYVAGQSFDIARGTPHTFRNAGEEEAGVIWQVRPALKTQQFYETLWGLAADGKTNNNGIPSLLQMAVMLQDYADEFVLSSPPRFVQRAAFAVLAQIGRLRGYRGRYERYSGPEADQSEAFPRKPHTAQASVWIDRPVREVFGYIENYDNDAQWRNLVSMRQSPSGETRVGTVTREEIDFLGQRYVTVATITRHEPNKCLVWEATESAFPIAGWRVAEPENGGTRFSEAVTAEIGGLNRLFAPLMVRALRKQMQTEVEALKRLLEQQVSATIPDLQHEAA
jgi:quercetin dioxygenase-like cupin family protein